MDLAANDANCRAIERSLVDTFHAGDTPDRFNTWRSDGAVGIPQGNAGAGVLGQAQQENELRMDLTDTIHRKSDIYEEVSKWSDDTESTQGSQLLGDGKETGADILANDEAQETGDETGADIAANDEAQETGDETGAEIEANEESQTPEDESYEEKISRYQCRFKRRPISECLDEIVFGENEDIVLYDALLREVALRVELKKNNPEYRSPDEVKRFWSSVREALRDDEDD